MGELNRQNYLDKNWWLPLRSHQARLALPGPATATRLRNFFSFQATCLPAQLYVLHPNWTTSPPHLQVAVEIQLVPEWRGDTAAWAPGILLLAITPERSRKLVAFLQGSIIR